MHQHASIRPTRWPSALKTLCGLCMAFGRSLIDLDAKGGTSASPEYAESAKLIIATIKAPMPLRHAVALGYFAHMKHQDAECVTCWHL
jgi:hypothetical protein